MSRVFPLLLCALIGSSLALDQSDSFRTQLVVEIRYKDFDQYYLDCMSFHDGPSTIRIFDDGSLELTCEDGHAPHEPHRIKYTTPFIH